MTDIAMMQSPTDVAKESSKSSTLVRSSSLVRFEDVHVQEYPITVGDNPGGMMGIPITIDWQPVSCMIYDVDNYEEARTGNRRSMQQLRMHSKYREQVLLDLGFSKADLNWGLRMANIGRGKRKRTLKFIGLHDRIQNISQKLRHLVTMGGRKRNSERLECAP